MGRLGAELRHVEADVAAQIRRAHLAKQLGRLAAGVVGSVVLSLMHGGLGRLDSETLLPLAAAALWTQLANLWPQVPWDLLRVRLGLPTIPPGGASEARWHPGVPAGAPMQGVEGIVGQTATVSNPSVPGRPDGVQIKPEG